MDTHFLLDKQQLLTNYSLKYSLQEEAAHFVEKPHNAYVLHGLSAVAGLLVTLCVLHVVIEPVQVTALKASIAALITAGLILICCAFELATKYNVHKRVQRASLRALENAEKMKEGMKEGIGKLGAHPRA